LLLLARRIARPVTRLVSRLSGPHGSRRQVLSDGIVALAEGDLARGVALTAQVEPVQGGRDRRRRPGPQRDRRDDWPSGRCIWASARGDVRDDRRGGPWC